MSHEALGNGEATSAAADRALGRIAPVSADEPVRLRQVTRADTPAVVALHHAALDAAGANAGPGEWDDDLEDIQSHYLDTGGEFVVGTLGGCIVAMGALRPVRPGTAEVKRMRVHPRWQGWGVGRMIIDYLERRAVELGFTSLYLDTTTRQHAAISLYRSRGFTQTGTGIVAGQPSVFFQKQLGGRQDGVLS
ncbi:GNAT family N-acetyltransferase [Actinokineospora xionganensis]|uniref:GNAT family N-acetyltransferase n=1 Tax=Actinokineospora xionganensis TaxID=2684470 RepID=A0ABR7L675_9PSEU|nr:GNAT family N-acetyltransferase [Actinokineospora xionganensis]MBC6447919.1 GNAT family N-acetyltransferase [Actinokineospora xionganensis]